MDPQLLITTAGTAIVSFLAKTAAEGTVTGGGKLWAWLKGKLTGPDAETAAAIEAAPGKSSATPKIEALLHDTLDARPELMKELEAMLREVGLIPSVTQTISGNTGDAAQIVGAGNTVTQGR